MLGFRGLELAGSSTPLDTLADHNNVGWLGYIIDLGVSISFFGSSLGTMAGTSRTIFTIAKDGLLPGSLARVSATHRTPVAAVYTLALFYLAIGIGGCLLADAATSYGVLGTFSGYWLVVDYGLCAIAAGIYAVRKRVVGIGIAAVTLLGIAGLVIVFYYSFNPFPEGSYAVVAWIFIAGIAATLLAVAVMLTTRSRALDRMGSADRLTHRSTGRSTTPNDQRNTLGS